MADFLFLTPVDVLYLRGNRLFGGAGQHSEALMPPWPSVAAGALRTRILVDQNFSLGEYAANRRPGGSLGDVLGIPSSPGTFRVCCFLLGKMEERDVTMFFPLPADLAVVGEAPMCRYLYPTPVHKSLLCSSALDSIPVLKVEAQSKIRKDLWLTESGFGAYLNGEKLTTSDLIAADELWVSDNRLGIALDATRRCAETGRIYTSETVAMKKDFGFVAGVEGAQGVLPNSGVVRFGGDGRAVTVDAIEKSLPEPRWETIERTKRFRIVLGTPGIFNDGWLPPGTTKVGNEYQWNYRQMKAKLVAAAQGRAEVVSGWDLAEKRPKRAFKAVPVGSVYWFEAFEGEIEELRRLTKIGLWEDSLPEIYIQRKVEGFNTVFVAAWHQQMN